MIKVLVTTVCVLAAALCCGQYTYFNNYYLPSNYPESIPSVSGNLLIRDSSLITAGLISSDFLNKNRFHFITNLQGEIINEINIPLSPSDSYQPQYGDNFRIHNESYYTAVNYYNDSLNNAIPAFFYINESFELEWSRMFNQFQADTIFASGFNTSIMLDDESVVAAGVIASDYDPFEPGQDKIHLIISKFDQDSVYWLRQFPIFNQQYFPTESFGVRISTITPLINGDLLLWGAWTHQWDPMVMRFNSEGEFISEIHWGNPELDDWCAWPVQLNDSLFMFSNMHAMEYVDPWSNTEVEKPMVGLFNANQMDTVWTKIYDHPLAYSFIYDFEKTDDGGNVVLGQGINLTFDAQFVYMMKVDNEGNELWYHSYAPPVEEFTTAVGYDLEVTPDGGLAFVGSFLYEEDGNTINPTWLVKTDACGDVVFNGCPTAVAEWTMGNAQWTIAPNPANHFVNILSDVEFESIAIRDITGKLVYTSAIGNHVLQTQVDVSVLAKGIYLIEVDYGNGVICAQKLVVE